jgi:2'-5' RNA ligase
MGFPDHEFVWSERRSMDPLKQAQTDAILVGKVYTINELREARGDDPRSEPEADKLGMFTPTGFIPLGETASPQGTGPTAGGEGGAKPGPGSPGEPPDKPAPKKKPGGDGPDNEEPPAKKPKQDKSAKKLAKFSYGTVQVDVDPASIAGMILQNLRKEIADEDLAGDGIPSGFHVTVRYGILDDDTAMLRSYLQTLSPFTATLGDVIAFDPTENSDWAAPLVVKVTSPELEALNAGVERYANWKPASFDYHPHVTLAYIKSDPDVVGRYLGQLTPPSGITFRVNSISICPKDGPEDVVYMDAGAGSVERTDEGEFQKIGTESSGWWGPHDDAGEKKPVGRFEARAKQEQALRNRPKDSLMAQHDAAKDQDAFRQPVGYGHHWQEGDSAEVHLQHLEDLHASVTAHTRIPENDDFHLQDYLDTARKHIDAFRDDPSGPDAATHADTALSNLHSVISLGTRKASGGEDPEVESELQKYDADPVGYLTEQEEILKLCKSNPYHEPAGSPEGGQFASADEMGTVRGLVGEQRSMFVHPTAQPAGPPPKIKFPNRPMSAGYGYNTVESVKEPEEPTAHHEGRTHWTGAGHMGPTGPGITTRADDPFGSERSSEHVVGQSASAPAQAQQQQAQDARPVGDRKHPTAVRQAGQQAREQARAAGAGATTANREAVRARVKEMKRLGIPWHNPGAAAGEPKAVSVPVAQVAANPDLSPMEKTLKTAKVKSIKDKPGNHVNEVASVTLVGGQQAIWKPQSEDERTTGNSGHGRGNMTKGYGTEREQAAWEVAKRAGYQDIAIPCVIRDDIKGQHGVLMQKMGGHPARDVVGDKYDDEGIHPGRDAARIAVFDYAIGNEDRHAGNWRVEDNGHLIMQDHGLSFPDKGDYGERANGDPVWGNRLICNHVAANPPNDPPAKVAAPLIQNRKEIVAAVKTVGLPPGSAEGLDQRIGRLAKMTKVSDWDKFQGVGRSGW